jgi:hypothetical protein
VGARVGARLGATAPALVLVLVLMPALAGVAAARPESPAMATPPASDGALSLPSHGGGSLGSLTVEGTSQVRIRFERPALKLDLDPLAAPGLECEPTIAILERTPPDLALPLLRSSASGRAARTPRPWLSAYTVGSLARLKPEVKGVSSWRLEIVDANGVVVSSRDGEGSPPRELPWDGVRDDGSPAPCGQSYAHVLTARDRAGNTRRFVGESFQLPAYRVETAAGPCLLFSAAQWRESFGDGGISPLLIETATVINLGSDPSRPLMVTVTAPTAEEAEALGRDVIDALAPRVGGGDRRLELHSVVSAGSPVGGSVQVALDGTR